MFFKRHFCLLVVGLFIAGFFVFFIPQNASAGATGLGCCINNGGNCNPGCGSEGDSCFRDFDAQGNNPCTTDQQGSSCGGIDAKNVGNVGCFIEGFTCLQVSASEGECVPAGAGPECATADTCPDPDPTCFTPVCEGGSCGSVATGDPSCEPAESTGTLVLPTLGQWGMIIAAVMLGFFAVVMLWRRKDSEI